MLEQVVSAEALFEAVVSATSSDSEKLRLITDFKTFVKRLNVETASVPKYLEALSIGTDSSNPAVLQNSFSAICYTVKRVNVQNASSVLKEQAFLVLPIIINRLGDAKLHVRIAAKKALEGYWLSAHSQVEQSLVDIGFTHRSPVVVSECVQWLTHIVAEVNPQFKMTPLVRPLVKLLAPFANDPEIVDNIKTLFRTYYSLSQNRLYRFDLQKELEMQLVAIKDEIMVFVGLNPLGSKKSLSGLNVSPAAERRTATVVRHPVLARASPGPSDARMASTPRVMPETSRHPEPVPADSQLGKIVAALPNYAFDPSLPPVDVFDESDLYRHFSDMAPAFSSKETEFNWTSRERNIISLRSILRGNASTTFTQELVHCLRENAESICKAISSLRTTLSAHGCQLVKEAAMILQHDFDSLVDLFVPPLLKLCSATKNLASTSANVTLCAIFLNVSYHYKLLQKVLVSSNEKSISPRTYSGIWMQILLIRFHNDGSFLAAHGPNVTTGVEVSVKVITKLLGDPNPNVRQVSKDAFWCFWGLFQAEAETLLSKLDVKTVKGIERSKPKDDFKATATFAPMLNSKKSRPSIKESIIAKNKEMRSKLGDHSDLRSSSRLASWESADPSRGRRTPSDIPKQVIGIVKRPSSLTLAQVKRETSRNPQSDARLLPNSSQATETKAPTSTATTRSTVMPQTSTVGFDKQNDPILKFLASSKREFVEEGVHLMRYAIMGNEDLSTTANDLLRQVSLTMPEVLKPLFSEGENLFKRTCTFFSPEDFLRVCSILIEPSEKNVAVVISLLKIDDIHDSISNILSYASSLDNIIDDDQLTMQIIRCKSKMINMLVRFLVVSLEKIPITDSHFVKLVSNLLDLVYLLHGSEDFKVLLNKLYFINLPLFMSELKMKDANTNEEVESLVGVDKTLDLTNHMLLSTGLNDLTKITPGSFPTNMSPLKVPSEFTMILPGREILSRDAKSNGKSASTHEIVQHVASENMDIDAEPEFYKVDDNIDIEENNDPVDTMDVDKNGYREPAPQVTPESDMSKKENQHFVSFEKEPVLAEVDKFSRKDPFGGEISENPFRLPHPHSGAEKSKASPSKRQSSPSDSDIFAKYSKDHPGSLADDFAQVKITELKALNSKDSIQSFIDRVDPLNKISGKNKPISIYEDATLSGSPQKVRDYNHTELNWFNFQIAKYSLELAIAELEEESVQRFKSLCQKLSSATIEGRSFISLLGFLQGTHNVEFSSYYQQSGIGEIESSLWSFFDHKNEVSELRWLSGLILLKQLLINRSKLNVNRMFHLLVELSGLSDGPTSELSHAINETFDEVLCGIYPSQSILNLVLNTLGETGLKENSRGVLFVLESLAKVLGLSSFNMMLSDDLMLQLDGVLSALVNHPEVEVRRCVILSYVKLLKALRVHYPDMNRSGSVSEKDVMGNILQKLTVPQRKLIEYYSQG